MTPEGSIDVLGPSRAPQFPRGWDGTKLPPHPQLQVIQPQIQPHQTCQELIYDGWRWQFSLFSNTPESLHLCRNHSSDLFSQIVRRIARSGTQGLHSHVPVYGASFILHDADSCVFSASLTDYCWKRKVIR
jgi:hypothetical protein